MSTATRNSQQRQSLLILQLMHIFGVTLQKIVHIFCVFKCHSGFRKMRLRQWILRIGVTILWGLTPVFIQRFSPKGHSQGIFSWRRVLFSLIRGGGGGKLVFTPYVRPSARPTSRVSSVTSTVQDGFFPYLVQLTTSMRRCIACDDLCPWPISSMSFNLDFENRVRSVKFSVLDQLFPYLPQIITTIRGCVAC